jgi:hypothetical protein
MGVWVWVMVMRVVVVVNMCTHLATKPYKTQAMCNGDGDVVAWW